MPLSVNSCVLPSTVVDLHGASRSGGCSDSGGLLVEQTSSPSLSLLRGQPQPSVLQGTPHGIYPGHSYIASVYLKATINCGY